MAPRCDAIVVIGSANSSNTRALEKLAREGGCPTVVRINRADELPDGLHGLVGVTAGASAPEELVDEVLTALSPVDGVELVTVTEEDEYFPPPRQLRELQHGFGLAMSSMLGARMTDCPFDDTSIPASLVLQSLGASLPVSSTSSKVPQVVSNRADN
jgi:4-hydroxy-3-methylbut-2-enyl diphosphate reductase